jgi:hypothetical protein
MADSNLDTSLSAVSSAILSQIPTATIDELVNLSRAALQIGESENATIETAINARVNTLVSGATATELKKLGDVINRMKTTPVTTTADSGSSGPTAAVTTSDTAPSAPSDGDLWWNSSNGGLYLYYNDGSSTQWVSVRGATGPAGADGVGGGSSVTTSDTAPTSPNSGDQWFDTTSGTLYVYYNDGTSSQWIGVSGPSGTDGADGTDGVDGVAGTAGYATVVADMAGLIAITGMVAGQTALVTALNKVFMYTGSAWFLIATMTNGSPTAITGVDGSYTLATDGTATTITAISTDPEGFPLTWSYAVTSGSLGSTATVSQADNVFTVTPSTTEADAGSFSITFSVTDGATGAVSVVSAFTLTFLSEDIRLNISSTFPGPTYPNEVPANHAASGQYLDLTQTMSNNTRYGNIDFGPDNFEEIWVEVKGGNGGISTDTAGYASGGSGSRIRASLDLTAIHTAYGHKKINFSVGQNGGAKATSPGNGSGGGASAIWVWSNSDGTSGTAIPLIVAAGGGGGSSDGTFFNNNVQGKDAFLPSSNMTTIQLFSHFSGFHSTINVGSRPWLNEGPTSTGSGHGASWSEIGFGYPHNGFAKDVYSIRDQFSLNNNPAALNSPSVGANSPTFGGGGTGMYGGGGGGGYFGGFHGDYNPPLGGMGGQSYIDTSYATLINHIVSSLAPEIKIHKVNSSW